MKRNCIKILLAIFIPVIFFSCSEKKVTDPSQITKLAQQEFLAARFGLFIHFGLYCSPAAVWKGDTVPVGGMSEHIMRILQIPKAEYHEIATSFNPSEFNPNEIVSLAKRAGMQYIVITAKHHDGFAMFDSDYDDYNIKDGTPYGKDLLKELSDECKKQKMKLGFYYSHTRDWDEYNSIDKYGNNWDWDRNDPERNLQKYFDSKVKLQLTELLTNYGDVFCLWFDTPGDISTEQATELYNLVKELQPSCLVNSRIGAGLGDYGVMGDNQVPPGVLGGVWECPATMNHSWGYHQFDNTWKSTSHMILQLVDLASKNINYLLDIGPKGDGSLQEESVKKLYEIGEWMETNGEAIYKTGPSPWFQELDDIRITTDKDVLYITILNPEAEKVTLYNLNNEIIKIESLKGNIPVQYKNMRLETPEIPVLIITIPDELKNELFPVIRVSIKGSPDVLDLPTQMSSGDVLLQAGMATVVKNQGNLKISGMDGVIDTNNWPYFATRDWTSTKDFLEWELNIIEPGIFEVQVVNVSSVRDIKTFRKNWNSIYKKAGDFNKIIFELDEKKVEGIITAMEPVNSIRSAYRPEFINKIGTVEIDRPGVFTAALKAGYINPEDNDGMVIYEVRLVKMKPKN